MAGPNTLLSTVAVSVVAGTGCQLLARRLSQPAILPLLLAGMALGPSGAGLVDPDALGEGLRVVVGLAVAVILFEGGLSLKYEALQARGRAITQLVTLGAAITWLLAAVLGWLLFRDYGEHGLSWSGAALFGSLVIVTGPTVIQPMLRAIRPREPVADVLRGEAVVVDPIGALAAVLTLEVLLALSDAGGAALGVGGAVKYLGLRLALGVGLGLAAAWLMYGALCWRAMTPPDLRNLLVLVGAIGCYAASEVVLHESGVLTVTVAGLVLGWLDPPGLEEIEEFKLQLTMLMVSLVFILLAAAADIGALFDLGWRGIALVLGLVFIVRPASVLPSMAWTPLTWPERLFICWISPRGIIAASVSALFALLLVGQGDLEAQGALTRDLVFAVIIGTVLLQAPTAGLIARLLGVVEHDPRGVVIVGANRNSRQLAKALWDNGVKVLLVDTNRERVHRARNQGLPARAVNLLDEHEASQLNLAGLGLLLAMTTNDSINRLAVHLHRHTFGEGRARAIRLADSPTAEEVKDVLDGHDYLFGELTWEALDDALRRGQGLDVVCLPDPSVDLAEALGPDAVPLLAIGADGRAHPLGKDRSIPRIGPRCMLIYLA